MNMSKLKRPMTTGVLATLLVVAGVDGFLLLEPLREAGARPFFLLFLAFVIAKIRRAQLMFSRDGLIVLGVIAILATTAFLLRGASLAPFADKVPLTQFVAQGMLFFIGFSPLALRMRTYVDAATLDRALWLALATHAVIIAIDGLAINAELPRPTEGSFLAEGGRIFPTGMFSEPSYFAGYFAMLLPAALYRCKVWQITVVSAVAGAFFFVGDVRSFFPVYAVGFATLALCRWGLNWRFAIGLLLGGATLVFVASQLNLSSVEENLSSAYRLGNALSFAQYAIANDWVIGNGFGSSHFLYPDLDHPAFLYLSNEFHSMLSGEGFRVPVFNLWIRLFVEIGIPATLLLLYLLLRALLSTRVLPQVKILLAASVTFGLSTDSYIYGTFSLAMFLTFSISNAVVRPKSARLQPETRMPTPPHAAGAPAI